jgi:hypothetical protein
METERNEKKRPPIRNLQETGVPGLSHLDMGG